MVNYDCGFNQSETGKYFEWIIILFSHRYQTHDVINFMFIFMIIMIAVITLSSSCTMSQSPWSSLSKVPSLLFHRHYCYFISFHDVFDNPKSRETTQDTKTARVRFDEGGNWRAHRKPSKSGWDQLKTHPHTTLVVEVRGVLMITGLVWLTQEYSGGDFPDGHPSSYQPRPTRLNFYERTGTSVSPLVQTVFSWFCSRLHFYYQQCHFCYHHEFDQHVPDSHPLLPS